MGVRASQPQRERFPLFPNNWCPLVNIFPSHTKHFSDTLHGEVYPPSRSPLKLWCASGRKLPVPGLRSRSYFGGGDLGGYAEVASGCHGCPSSAVVCYGGWINPWDSTGRVAFPF